jgi:hypothetical protein
MPREMKKSASGVRKVMIPYGLRGLTGVCSIRFRSAARLGGECQPGANT